MPRYWDFTCEYCGQPAHKPGNQRPKYCSIQCRDDARRQEISDRIGEPMDTAIQRRYVLERMSYREIATELGINGRTVMRTLNRLGIKVRQGGEATATQWENNDERREAIGQVFAKCSKERIGPKHPHWRGGFLYDTSTKKWTKRTAEIRERDDYCCTSCGMTNDRCLKLFGKSLSVHHIIPYRFSRDHSPSNLRSLCMKCHLRIEQEFIWLL